MVDVTGIEPVPSGCKPDVLPLSLNARTTVAESNRSHWVCNPTPNRLAHRGNGGPCRSRTCLFAFVAQSPHPEEGPKVWSGRPDSNRHQQFGRLWSYHWTTSAQSTGAVERPCGISPSTVAAIGYSPQPVDVVSTLCSCQRWRPKQESNLPSSVLETKHRPAARSTTLG